MTIRSPIIVTVGHVDAGKTTLLDSIRGTTVAAGEPGLITQYISASYVPTKVVNSLCSTLLSKMRIDLKIPGLLFIDTPGHEAFTTLRKRGGAIADLAILVVDAMEGFKPQTFESLNYLKQFKTPFVVAMTKVDRLAGWMPVKRACFHDSLKEQGERANEELEKKLYNIAGQLGMQGINADRYDRVEDYTKQVAIVPVSGATGEGVPDLIITLAGLAQRYLGKNLEVTPGEGKGTVLEVKEFKGLGTTIDVVIYDGEISRGDSLVIGGLGEKRIIVTRAKALLQPQPLKELRLEKEFSNVESVSAAAGIKIAAPDLDGVTAGAPIRAVSDESRIPELEKEILAEMDEVEIETDEEGVFLKSDTLGGLEALVKTLKERGIPVMKAHVGSLTKSEVLSMKTGKDPIIMTFGIKIADDVAQLAKDNRIALFSSNIIYSLLEEYDRWVKDRKKREEQALLDDAIRPGELRVLKGYVFRQSKPAVFGIEVLRGVIKPGYRLMLKGKVIGEIKEIQMEGMNKQEAKAGDRCALSMDGVVIGKDFSENDVLQTHFTTETNLDRIRVVRKLLRDDERAMLDEAGV
jgi:translation initiation factor 5B